MQYRLSPSVVRAAVVTVAAIILLASSAQAMAHPPDPNPEWQPVYDRLMREIMSPFCQGLTLADCPTKGAAEMRDQIRAWLIEGKDRIWIEDQLVAQYGQSVLGAPRMSGWGLLAWVTPPLALFFGVVAVASFVKRHQAEPGEEGSEAAPAHPAADPGEISEIEKQVEEEIGDWTS